MTLTTKTVEAFPGFEVILKATVNMMFAIVIIKPTHKSEGK